MFAKASNLYEAIEMFEDANAHFIQISHESLKDGQQILHGQLWAKNASQLVDAECQGTAHFPLQIQIQFFDIVYSIIVRSSAASSKATDNRRGDNIFVQVKTGLTARSLARMR